jgi:hypothetical protein
MPWACAHARSRALASALQDQRTSSPRLVHLARWPAGRPLRVRRVGEAVNMRLYYGEGPPKKKKKKKGPKKQPQKTTDRLSFPFHFFFN